MSCNKAHWFLVLSNFTNIWFKPRHSLFFIKQYWYRFRYKKYFDSIEKFPLTVKQRQSIIADEKRILIIAGAGTGKTSTIVGKVGFLVKSKKAKPSEILAIAYNRNAAKELKERIKTTAKINVDVGTFHSIGKSILQRCNSPYRPHEFVDQEEKLYEFLNQILQRYLQLNKFSNLYVEYFKKYEFRNVDEVKDFQTEREYANWLRSNKLVTLNNERVKSHGELLIANFLFSNGIEYKYEDFYKSDTTLSEDIDYRPDFYLPKYKIYLEYFGIDEEGNTAAYISKDEYNKEIQWKFGIHKHGNTKLIDLYFYQKKNGVLLQILSDRLKTHGIKLSPTPNRELFRVISNTGKDKRFLKLVQKFLSQYKERQNNVDLSDLMKKSKDDERVVLFLRIFNHLLSAYQQILTKNRKIDFGDMISRSADLVSKNKSLSKYKYIIIDEFQDISDGRYNLITQLLTQNTKTKLFCVGDDWQAIYRFAGSDHKIMTNFTNLFGKTTIVKLDQTFRYNEKIASVSEQFITQNPSQIKKGMKTLSLKQTPQVFVHWHHNKPMTAIKQSIKTILNEYNVSNETLLILTRYNHNQLTSSQIREVKNLWTGGSISQRSIHSSKGLEADFVIVADVTADHHGFPSEIHDDPILKLVLAEEDKFKDSEERRLLYVALTRSKHQTHLIADASCPSRFAEELANGKYQVTVTGDQKAGTKCPACFDGVLLKKNGTYGDYYSCFNFPVCDFKPLLCPTCNSDIVLRKTVAGKEIAICHSDNCRSIHECCDHCKVGVFKIFQSKNGKFLGCHDFLRSKCKGKKNISKNKSRLKFEEWSTNFETYISEFIFTEKYDFYYSFNAEEKRKIISIDIYYNKEGVKTDFMSIFIDLDNFKISIPDAITTIHETIEFEEIGKATSFIEGAIIQRRNLLRIAHPSDNNKRPIG